MSGFGGRWRASQTAASEFLGQDIGPTTGAAADHLVHPMATSVFVVTQDSLVRVREGRLRVEKNEETLHAVALNKVRQVVGFGRVGFTSYALRALGRERIDVVLMDEDGSDAVRLVPVEAPHPGLRRAQYRAAEDDGETLRLARPFVLGKVGNQATALHRWFPADDRVQPAVAALGRCRETALGATSLDVLRGAEGAAARAYFQAWSALTAPEWQFHGRQRRPPPDPVNAMLSLGYTLLTNEAISACHAVGLDPFQGYLHRFHHGAPSLALDLIEELRPAVVDAAVHTVMTNGAVSAWEHELHSHDGCRLVDKARRAFLAAYENRMLTKTARPDEDGRASYRTVLHAQARSLAACLLDRSASYRPVAWRV